MEGKTLEVRPLKKHFFFMCLPLGVASLEVCVPRLWPDSGFCASTYASHARNSSLAHFKWKVQIFLFIEYCVELRTYSQLFLSLIHIHRNCMKRQLFFVSGYV